MATYSATGIVLRKTDFSQGSQLFFIYTKEYGKVEAVSRGTKKMQSKLRGHLEPYAIVQLLIAHGRKFDQIAGALRLDSFVQIITQLEKIGLASFGLELVDRLTHPGISEPAIFDLLADYLAAVDQAEVTPEVIAQYQHSFTLKLLTQLGIQPDQATQKNPARLYQYLVDQLQYEPSSHKFLAKISEY